MVSDEKLLRIANRIERFLTHVPSASRLWVMSSILALTLVAVGALLRERAACTEVIEVVRDSRLACPHGGPR